MEITRNHQKSVEIMEIMEIKKSRNQFVFPYIKDNNEITYESIIQRCRICRKNEKFPQTLKLFRKISPARKIKKKQDFLVWDITDDADIMSHFCNQFLNVLCNRLEIPKGLIR